MVLSKRKRNGEFVVCNPSLQDQPQMSMSQQSDPLPSVLPEVGMPPTKKTRTNPTRSAKATNSELLSNPKPPATKKKRAPRAKQPSASTQRVMGEAGPSQTAAPPPKKGRKKAAPAADSSESQPEKRGAILRTKCPQNILDRVERVMTQRYVVTSHFTIPLHFLMNPT